MRNATESVSDSTWWETVQGRTATPIGELIGGLDTIADQAIPYGWLPRRARTYYGDDLTTWSDLANHTIASLMSRRRSGVGTVRAILTAARDAAVHSIPPDNPADAASATREMIDRLTATDRTLLRTRRWPLRPTPTRDVARELGVAVVNVQRNHPRAYQRFMDLVADPRHTAVTAHADDLRRRLGAVTTEHNAGQALQELGLDLDTDAGQMLLHLAGPYTPHDDWLETAGGVEAATAGLGTAFDEHGAPSAATLIGTLEKLGINPQIATTFIEKHPGLRRFDSQWVRWGDTHADKVEAALHLCGRPTAVAPIAAMIDLREGAVRTALSGDPRFARVSKQNWGLRCWGISEYTSLFAEIGRRIDSTKRGRIDTMALIDELDEDFPDFTRNAIRSYLSAPAFIIENGTIRRRKKADGWRKTLPLRTVRGVYRNGDSEIRAEIQVTAELLRGSGQILAPSLATALGVNPGQHRDFTGTPADIRVVWRLSSLNGASVGSLRGLATTLGAELGDSVVLVFNLPAGTVQTVWIPADADPMQRLRAVLGKRTTSPVAALARALDCPRQDVAAVLTRRRDTACLALLDAPTA